MMVKWPHCGANELLSNLPSSEEIKESGGDSLEVMTALASAAKEKNK